MQNIKTIFKIITQQQAYNVTQQSTHSNTLLSVDFIGVCKEIKAITDTVKDTHITQNLSKNEDKKTTNSFNFRNSLIQYGFKIELVDDWLKVRKTKRATNTKTAFDNFIKEIEKRTCDINEMLEIAATNSWSGFKYSWVDNLKKQNQNEKTQSEQQFKTVSNDFARKIAKGFQS